jgi:hypothetical protein
MVGRNRRMKAWALLGLTVLLALLPLAASGSPAGGSAHLPREQLQIRPLGDPAPSCHHLGTGSVPAATHRLAVPYAGAFSGCVWLGPAIIATSSVSSVVEGQSPAGSLLVAVQLLPKDDRTLKALALSHPHSFYAVVLLGKILSTPEGDEFSHLGPSTPFQIAGGLYVDNAMPQQVAEVLRTSLRVSPPPCDMCFAPSQQS